jgi:hypothetical protein
MECCIYRFLRAGKTNTNNKNGTYEISDFQDFLGLESTYPTPAVNCHLFIALL